MIKVISKGSWGINKLQEETRKKFVEWINSNDKVDYIVSCPVCEEKSFVRLSNVDRFGLNFEFKMCENCNLVLTNPQIKEAYLPEYYDRYYHPLIFGSETALDYLFSPKQGEKIFSLMHNYLEKDHISVFEVGAGSAGNLVGFREAASKYNITCDLEGLEFSQKYVEHAKKLNIDLYTDQLKDFSLINTRKYDVIILSHVFEHINNLKDFLEDLKKLMHEKSLLYIEVPGILNLHTNRAYKCNFKNYLVHAHIYHFTAETLEKVLVSNGFNLFYINEEVASLARLGAKQEPLKEKSDIINYLENLKKTYKICLFKNFINTFYFKVYNKISRILI